MTRTIFATSAAGIAMLVSAPAFAQDAPATYDGFYVGGSVSLDTFGDNDGQGISFDTDQDGQFGDVVTTTTRANAFSPGFCTGAATGPLASQPCTNDDDDIGYAVRIGYDKRIGNVAVAGVLIEGSTSNAREFSSGFSTTPASYTTIRELDYAISARGRLGISPGDGRGLIYATGGVSYARIDHDFVTTNGANSFDVINNDDMVFGGQVGGGAEVIVAGGLTIGVEYLYSRYDDDKSFVAVGPGTAGPTNPFLLTSGGTNLRPGDTDFATSSFRATVGYRF